MDPFVLVLGIACRACLSVYALSVHAVEFLTSTKSSWYPKKMLHVMGVQEMQGAEDDDSWMRDGAAELERELAARQAEMDPSTSEKLPSTTFDPENLAERMKVSYEAHLTNLDMDL